MPVFLLSLLSGWMMIMFQVTGFYCNLPEKDDGRINYFRVLSSQQYHGPFS